MAGGPFAVHAAQIWGAEALPVTAEVSMSGGVPGTTIVGRPDTSVMDGSSRVRRAIVESGFEQPRYQVVVNLAPGERRKSGTGFDLPIAVAILAASHQIPSDGLDGALFVGEVGLYGTVSPVRGMVAYALLAKELGLSLVASPESRLPEALADVLIPVSTLAQLRAGLKGLGRILGDGGGAPTSQEAADAPDYGDVIDQEIAKRAITIAAAGRHGMLMVGPPGSGKTMLARCMPSILPPMSTAEQLETLLIHSVAGETSFAEGAYTRPFRAPHHSVTAAGMVGGGRPVLPGEISLAHNGVLFLDELPEFAPSVLQMLRQPMEDKCVRIVRADSSYEFPCNFQLVASANPCPCGYLGDPGHQCRCSPAVIDRYQGRIGGPLMDRIDIMVNVARPDEKRVIAGVRGTTSATMRDAVMGAREFASWRRERGLADGRGVVQAACLGSEATRILESVAHRMAFGGRAIARVVRVARTIADLAEREEVAAEDVMEAASFRATMGEAS